MIFKKPYGFLIKHFKLIHLILTGLYIYLAVKVNNILTYYNNFISGTASKLDANSYITYYYLIAILLSIIICIIIYALMRYKKKPRSLYLVLIGFSIVIAWMVQYVYQGLDTIYISVLDTKSLLLNRDLLQILVVFQYVSIALVLVRGLGFDIKKFNFVQDLHELDIDVNDEEEVELTLGGTEIVGRKFHRNLRELRYYYLENKMFIFIIVGIVLVMGLGFLVLNNEVINKEYQQKEIFSTNDFQFQVLDSYITNKDYGNQEIKYNDTSFVVVRIRVGSTGEKKVLNTSNLILKVNNHSYSSEKRYASRFTDLGITYRDNKISGMTTYLFIYNIENDDLDKEMKIVYAEDKTVYLEPIDLDHVLEAKTYDLGKKIDLSVSSLASGSFQIKSMFIEEEFSYPYEYEIGGQIYTNQLTISSLKNVILNLEINASYPSSLNHYSFLKQYATLKYKKDGNEYISKALEDKTPGNYKNGLYLAVDKEVLSATNIWLEIRIRNLVYHYMLK